jgi:hypothetical protein
LAGAGITPGIAHGETDEHGIDIVSGHCHVHDYHATILHLMGIDHTRMTYRFAGRTSGKPMCTVAWSARSSRSRCGTTAGVEIGARIPRPFIAISAQNRKCFSPHSSCA